VHWFGFPLFGASTPCCVNLINEQSKEITCCPSMKSFTAAAGGYLRGKAKGKGK